MSPTDRAGIVGIGSLWHMGLKFANAWDCEVKAFTSSESKAEEAKRLGAHHIISSRDAKVIAKAASSLDFSVNLPLGWTALVKTLMPNLRLHVVGPVLERMPISAIDLIFGQKSVWGSPTGGSSTIAAMLDFAIRQNIAPQVDHFSLNTVYDAIEHLVSGKPRYRVVLDVA